ncbi:MAG TPA: EscN/YscN/HrcN family type III secretion system ATPase, partial [Thermosulfidibacter takaii]|nr:EscN/YscN/HrcN family type III secretion system ATPase [Thermosulfidibacter takaii]
VEGDDMADPIADSARAILDGHIVLSRELAHQNHYPPIDVLASVSRLLLDITSKYHQRMVNIFKDYLAAYHSAEDLINIGAYVRGSNRRVDRAIELIDRMREYLRQDVDEAVDLESSVRQLREVVGEV